MNSSALRTQGDGTESPDASETAASKIQRKPSVEDTKIEKLGKEYLAKQQTTSTTILFDPHQTTDSGKYNFPPPVQPKGKRFYFIPKLAQQSEVNRSLKKRHLNLVLIEPYKVSILEPPGSFGCYTNHCPLQACVNPILPYKKNENRVKIPSRNNLDINDLVSMHMKTNQIMGMNAGSVDTTDCSPMELLKKERDDFENQLKFQIQVNTELKVSSQ